MSTYIFLYLENDFENKSKIEWSRFMVDLMRFKDCKDLDELSDISGF